MRRSVAQLPLHGGRAPRWLFERMTRLAGAIAMAVVDEFGPAEMLRRLSDPWWFQAFGCVLGFDWHSSGVTTVTCGALKEAGRLYGDDLGILVAGGKGRTSRRTPDEIAEASDRLGIAGGEALIRASRLSAKVDSSAVQDGYRVYHHSFFFTPEGGWCVVQQGMDGAAGWARRYHWLEESAGGMVREPHAGVEDLGAAGGSGPQPRAGEGRARDRETLNLVALEGDAHREACTRLTREDPDRTAREIARLAEGPTLFAPSRHRVLPEDVDAAHLRRVVRAVHERWPDDFAALLGVRGVGPAGLRGLALVAEVVFGAPASRRDPTRPPPAGAAAAPDGAGGRGGSNAAGAPGAPPTPRWADYSHAHGGKDGHPFPVDREAYDRSIEVLHRALRSARAGDRTKTEALRRLARFTGSPARSPGGR